MGLIGNGFRHNLTGKLFGATSLDGGNPSVMVDWGHRAAANRNQFAGEAIASPQASVPSGARHPYVWVMPRVAGAIKSYRRTDARIDGSAVGELGFARSGSTTLTIDASAVAGLIVGATGTTALTIDGQAAIVASLNATGTATIAIDGTAVMGAIASLTGSSTLSIDGSCDLMALGYMTGTTLEAGLTPEGIARAVWQSLLSQYQGDGMAGKALSMASSGGVDLNALASAVVTALQATTIPVDVAAVNGVTVAGQGTEGNPWGPA